MSRPARGLRAFGLLSVACLVAAFAPSATAAPYDPAATQIVFTSITTPGVNVPSTPGTPNYFVTNDKPFRATAEFQDDTGTPRPLALDLLIFPVTVDLYADYADGTRELLGTQQVSSSATGVTFDVPAGLIDAGNDVRLHMEARPGTYPFFSGIEGDSDSFDVQQTSVVAPFNSNPTGVGGGGGQGTNTSCTPTVLEPVCGNLVLGKPAGVLSDQLGSVGDCLVAECLTDDYVQALVKLSPAVYNRSYPMKIVMRCHPSVCDALASGDNHDNTTGGGHNGGSKGGGHGYGVTNLKLIASLSADGALGLSPACKSKGVVGSGQTFCTDYANSFRETSGIWNVVWLSVGDARVSFPQ